MLLDFRVVDKHRFFTLEASIRTMYKTHNNNVTVVVYIINQRVSGLCNKICFAVVYRNENTPTRCGGRMSLRI